MVVIDVTPDTLDKVVTRAKTTGETVTKVVAAGYIKGEAAIDVVKQKAKDFDETHKISDKVKGMELLLLPPPPPLPSPFPSPHRCPHYTYPHRR